ncbi:outer membrane protein OmpK [Vibrio cholerae]|uniref:nucleoside-specific channel-forming Tsx family protein n=1 Tax=Vibrio cholerae TaxID=666 RepID=UPI00155E2C17|nr:outer membrane protein OmpK [Vibrio cholerae]EIR1600033.1 outer membrane protein OmpK [Vibrio cholerae]EIR1601750.1 outer membrane protein OmpK [Vibrio cholerae]EJL6572774.1 outer membrane protein OmpK [Vibrio cholerae]EJL6601519.1 outer membrane protein OmpK [Vibrio cholerae]EJL6619782.1 outer membrane protein OmpK [Vibrio cholerae]
MRFLSLLCPPVERAAVKRPPYTTHLQRVPLMRKSLLALSLLAATSAPVLAADYSDGDTHKNDFSWMQFNLMHAINEKPGNSDHTYLEMEFGGRSGIFDLYGYLDVFNLTDSDSSDKAGKDQLFVKFAPRMSIDGLTGKDLSFGPVQEIYLANYTTLDGGADYNLYDKDGKEKSNTPGFLTKWGIGSDVMVPWFGKMQFNLYKTYDVKAKEWNGYQFSTVWFKPFYFFENGSFISYQGYIDYEFGIDKVHIPGVGQLKSSHGGAMFNGIYWHSDQFAVGYGLKLYDDVYGLTDEGVAGRTSGVGHYLAVTYKW